MSARSGLVGKNPPGPIWDPLGPFFVWAGKIKKMLKFAYFPCWALAAIQPWWGKKSTLEIAAATSSQRYFVVASDNHDLIIAADRKRPNGILGAEVLTQP